MTWFGRGLIKRDLGSNSFLVENGRFLRFFRLDVIESWEGFLGKILKLSMASVIEIKKKKKVNVIFFDMMEICFKMYAFI